MAYIAQIDLSNTDIPLRDALPKSLKSAGVIADFNYSDSVDSPPPIATIDIERCRLLMEGLGYKKTSYKYGLKLLRSFDLRFDISLCEIPYLIEILAPSKLTIRGIECSSDFKRGYGWNLHYSELKERLTISYIKGGVSLFSRTLEVKS